MVPALGYDVHTQAHWRQYVTQTNDDDAHDLRQTHDYTTQRSQTARTRPLRASTSRSRSVPLRTLSPQEV